MQVMNNLEELQDKNTLKTIVVSQKNYDRLKELGFCGDSFNTTIGRLLDKVEGI